MPAPVRLGQAIDAELAAQSAAVERHDIVGECREIHDARHDVGLDFERSAFRVVASTPIERSSR